VEYLREGLADALASLIALDSGVLSAAGRSLWISSAAVLAATLLGIPLAVWLAFARFPGQRFVVLLFRAGMALPTVFIGIVCYGLFSRHGPLGPLDLLYTPLAIVAGELLLAVPIVVSITHGAVRSLDQRVRETAWTLGAGPLWRARTYVSEARLGISLGILTAFARCVTELGIAMMVGGNIRDRTRTLSTATAMETGKGEFSQGLAMGLLLLVIALLASAAIARLGREERS